MAVAVMPIVEILNAEKPPEELHALVSENVPIVQGLGTMEV